MIPLITASVSTHRAPLCATSEDPRSLGLTKYLYEIDLMRGVWPQLMALSSVPGGHVTSRRNTCITYRVYIMGVSSATRKQTGR